MLVSHDRYFMDKIVDHLFVFEGEGIIRDYPGNYTQFRLEEKLQQKETEIIPDKKPVVEAKPKEVKQQEKMSYKEKREWEEINDTMPKLEAQKNQIVIEMQNGSLPFEKINALSAEMTAITNELERMELRWLELSEKQS
jgi:ATP-binding cassette subfamily F protein uup